MREAHVFLVAASLCACGGGQSSTSKCDRDPSLCVDAGDNDVCARDPAKCIDAPIDASHVYDETPPLFTVTPVDLSGTYDTVTMRLGDLACDWSDPTYGFCFDAFGISPVIQGHPVIQNPTFDYIVAPGTLVRAASSGTVITVEEKPDFAGEFTVFVEPVPNSAYLIEYDHIAGPIAVGTVVTAGDTIGTASTCCDGVHALVELGVHYHKTAKDGTATNMCPANYGDSAFNARHDAAEAAQTTANPTSDHDATMICVVNHTP